MPAQNRDAGHRGTKRPKILACCASAWQFRLSRLRFEIKVWELGLNGFWFEVLGGTIRAAAQHVCSCTLGACYTRYLCQTMNYGLCRFYRFRTEVLWFKYPVSTGTFAALSMAKQFRPHNKLGTNPGLGG